jgi:hypothetical protein
MHVRTLATTCAARISTLLGSVAPSRKLQQCPSHASMQLTECRAQVDSACTQQTTVKAPKPCVTRYPRWHCRHRESDLKGRNPAKCVEPRSRNQHSSQSIAALQGKSAYFTTLMSHLNTHPNINLRTTRYNVSHCLTISQSPKLQWIIFNYCALAVDQFPLKCCQQNSLTLNFLTAFLSISDQLTRTSCDINLHPSVQCVSLVPPVSQHLHIYVQVNSCPVSLEP